MKTTEERAGRDDAPVGASRAVPLVAEAGASGTDVFYDDIGAGAGGGGDGGAMPGAAAGAGAAAALPWWRWPVAPGFFSCVWVLWVVAVRVLFREGIFFEWFGEVMAAVFFLPLLLAYGVVRLWSVAARRYGRWAGVWRVVMIGPGALVLGAPFGLLGFMGTLVLLCWVLQKSGLGPLAPAKPASSADSAATQGESVVEAASPAQTGQNAMNWEGCHER